MPLLDVRSPFPRRDWTGVPTATAAFLPVALRTFVRSVSARWEDDWHGSFGDRARTSHMGMCACEGAVVGRPATSLRGAGWGVPPREVRSLPFAGSA